MDKGGHRIARHFVRAPAHALGQVFQPEWFGQEAGEALAGEAGTGLLLAEAAHQDDRQVGPQQVQGAEGFHAVEPGHGQVQQHQAEILGRLLEFGQGLLAIGRNDDRETKRAQQTGQHVADPAFVVHDQDRAGAAPGLPGGRRCFRSLVGFPVPAAAAGRLSLSPARSRPESPPCVPG